ncbi:MAG: hypothetical protein Q8K61_12635 [Gallionella sp.]|nr:hypothetical protein [Gallionella sp.]
MNIKITIASICATLISLPIFAAPVEFDTPDAHVIVMRALDSWSGDDSASEESLDAVSKHKGGFRVERPAGDVLGYPLLFGFNSDAKADMVVQGVSNALKPFDFKLAGVQSEFSVGKPIALDPTKYTDFANYQRELYKAVVISDGNPAALHGRVSGRKFFSGVLSLVAIGIAGEKFGALGSQTVLNTGVAGDVYQLGAFGNAVLSPIYLPNFDASSYKSIDVRRVIQGNNDRLGQVIIAYKNDKTEDAENTALITAIVSLTGADTTIDAIKLARAEDLAKRQSIWDACVVEGRCKKD